MNRWLILLTFLTLINPAFGFDLDETVDDEIRKNYNPNKITKEMGIKEDILEKSMETSPEETLPSLPNITKYGNSTKTSNTSEVKTTYQYKPYTGGSVKIRKGTTFNVVSTGRISDWQKAGTIVKFKTNQPIYTKRYTIPASTVFKGEIIESHQPQITCNGGLVVIRVNSMIYNGQNIPINAYVTRANDKKIFLNNIKGERKYLKTIWQKGNWGRTLFSRMLSLTVNLGGEGSTFILSPFPIAYGTICLGANAIVSPFCAFFSKGGHVSIPAGRAFKIKLLDDAMI